MSRKGICIFCAATRKMSKEHVFPRWLKEFFPHGPTDTHDAYAIQWDSEKSAYETIFKKKHGSSGTRITVRVVCCQCNSEWMSNLENGARPLLTPLIKGEQHSISTDHQRSLATWIAKTVMTAEYRYPKVIAVPQDQRNWLMAKREPPIGWGIAIGDYQGKKWRSAVFYRQMISISSPEGTPAGFMQTTCFGLGRLFVQTISGPLGDLDIPPPEDESGSEPRQIWPPVDRILNWPPPTHLDDAKATYTVGGLARAAGFPAPPL